MRMGGREGGEGREREKGGSRYLYIYILSQ